MLRLQDKSGSNLFDSACDSIVARGVPTQRSGKQVSGRSVARKRALLLSAVGAAVASFGLSPFAKATSGTWIGTTNASWGVGTNWNGGVPGSADVGTFSTNGNGNTTLTLDTGYFIKSIFFNTTSATLANYTIGGSTANGGVGTGAGTLTLTAAGAITLGNTGTTALTETFNSPIVLGGAYSFTNAQVTAASTLLFAGNITNSGASLLTISGAGIGTTNISGSISDGTGVQSVTVTTTAGVVNLSGANTYSGATTLNGTGATLTLSGTNSNASGATTITAGTLNINNTTANNGGLAGGVFSLGGTIQNITAGAVSLSNVVNFANSVVFAGTQDLTFTKDLTITTALRSLTNNDNTGNGITFAGTNFYLSNVSTANGLIIAGTGKTTISSNISDSTAAGGVSTLSITNGGITTLSGTNSYSGTTTISNGTLNLAGSNSSAGGTVLNSGTLLLNSAANGGLASGSLTLTMGHLLAAGGNRVISNAVSYSNGEFTGTNSLNVNGKLTNATTSSRTLTNNMSGSAVLTFNNIDLSTLNTTAAAGFTITGSGTTTVTGIIANGTAFANPLTLSGGTLNLQGTGTFTGATTMTAAGTLNLSGTLGSGAGTPVVVASTTTGNSGTLNESPTGVITGTSSLLVNTLGSVVLAGTNNYIGATTNNGTFSLTGSVTNTAITVAAGTFNEAATGIAAGTSSFSVTGGTATLSGTNSFSGAVSLTTGTLNLNSASSLGNTTLVTLNSGTLDNTSGTPITSAASGSINSTFAFGSAGETASNSLTLNGTTAFALNSAHTITLNGTGTNLTLAAAAQNPNASGSTLTLTVNNGPSGSGNTLTIGGLAINNGTDASAHTATILGSSNVTISGAVTNGSASGAQNLAYNGSGVLALQASNSYLGNTSINGTGTLSLQAAGAVNVNTLTVSSGNLVETVANAISSGAGLTVSGGTANLSLSNNFSGGASVSAGTLLLGAAGAIKQGPVAFTGGTVNESTANGLAGTASLTVSGSNTVTLGFSNNYSGGTTLSGGTVNLGNSSALSSGSITLNAATLSASTDLSGVNALQNAVFTTASGPVTTFLGSNNIQLAGTYTGSNSHTITNNMTAGQLTLSGTQYLSNSTTNYTLTLNGASTSTTLISGPILPSSASGTGGTLSVATGGTVILAGTSSYGGGTNMTGLGTLSLTGTIGNGVGTGTAIAVSAGTFTESSTGVMAGTSSFAVSAGTAVLGGVNSYSGPTTVSGTGVLDLANSAAVANSSLLTLTAGTIDNTSGGTLTLTTAIPISLPTSGNIAFSTSGGSTSNSLNMSSSAVSQSGTTDTITLNGAGILSFGTVTNTAGNNTNLVVNYGSGATGALNLGAYVLSSTTTARTDTISGSGLVNVLGTISNGSTGGSNLTYAGTGTLILSGSNTYTGNTTISSGTVKLNNPNAIVSGNFGTLATAGTLDINGNSPNFGTLTNNGLVTSTSGTPTLTMGNASGGAGSFSGSMNVVLNAGATPSSFTSSTGFIHGGSLTLNANGAGAITIANVNNGGALTNSGSAAGVTTINTLVGSNVTNVTQSSATSVLTLSAPTVAYTGTTTVSAGTLNVTGGINAPLATTAVTVAGGAALNLVNGLAQSISLSGALTLGGTGTTNLGFELGASSASDSISTPGAAAVTNGIKFNFTELTGFGVGTYTLLSAASGLNGGTYSYSGLPGGFVYTPTVTGASVTLGVSNSTPNPLYWSGAVGDGKWNSFDGSLNSNFASNLAGTNAHATPGSGSTVIYSITNPPQSSGTIATTLEAPYSINDLIINNQNTSVSTITIGPGAGGNANTLTLAAGINVQSGAPSSVTISAPVILGGAQTWAVGDAASTLTISGAASGSGTLTKNGPGILVLSGANNLPDGVTVDQGTLTLGNTGANNGLGGGGTLTLGDSSGSANATVNVFDSGINYTNNINVRAGSSGVLAINSTESSSTISGPIALNNNLTLGMTRSANRTLFVASTITGSSTITTNSINNSGQPGVTFTGSNATSFTGNVIVNSGIMAFNADSIGQSSSPGTISLANGTQLWWNGTNSEDLSGRLSPLGASVSTSLNIVANNVTFATANGLAGPSTSTYNKLGTGVLTLAASNSFAGTISIQNGTVAVGNDAAFGTGTLILNSTPTSATVTGIESADSSAHTIANQLGAYSGSATLVYGDSTLGSNNGNLTFTNTSLTSLSGGGAAKTFAVYNTTEFDGGFTGGTTPPTSLTKIGPGTLVLAGTSIYTGGTIVNAGELKVNGALLSSGTVSVGGASATGSPILTGINGSLGAVTVNAAGVGVAGTINPGDVGVIGKLSATSLTIAGNYTADINTTANGVDVISPSSGTIVTGKNDLITVTSAPVLTGATLNLNLQGVVATGPNTNTYVLIEDTNSTAAAATGTFNVVPPVDSSIIYSINYNYNADGGSVANDVAITFTSVPEPSTLGLIGLAGLMLRRRRRAARGTPRV